MKKLLTLTVALAVTGLLVLGEVPSALAAGSNPGLSTTAAIVARKNAAVSMGVPLTREAKGVAQFGVDTVATLVTDAKGNAVVTGSIASLEIGFKKGELTGAAGTCYLLVFDSAVAADTTETGSVSRMLVPPLLVVTSVMTTKEFAYPKQFNRGAVVMLGGSGASNCVAHVGVLLNGGDH